MARGRDARGTARGQIATASGLNVIVGIWLIIAPFLLGHPAISAAVWNDVIVGILVLIFAGIRISGAYQAAWLSWINFVLGIWMIVAPFVFGYAGISAAALWNDIIVGAIILVLAAWSALATQASR